MIQFFGVSEIEEPARFVTEIDIEISNALIEVAVSDDEIEIEIECTNG